MNSFPRNAAAVLVSVALVMSSSASIAAAQSSFGSSSPIVESPTPPAPDPKAEELAGLWGAIATMDGGMQVADEQAQSDQLLEQAISGELPLTPSVGETYISDQNLTFHSMTSWTWAGRIKEADIDEAITDLNYLIWERSQGPYTPPPTDSFLYFGISVQKADGYYYFAQVFSVDETPRDLGL